MHTFKQYISEQRQVIELIEKQIIVGKGKRYGQVVFMAGGAGSGKGFAIKNFMEGEKFKVRDPDEYKKAFLRLAELKKKYKEIRGLDLKNPKDAFKLHKWIENKRIKQRTLTLLLQDAKRGILPNILIDTTMQSKSKIKEALPALLEAGYDPKNIHIIWVLTDYAVAIEQNRERERIVPDDIMLITHEGASTTMYNFIKHGTPRTINGGVYIVLGGRKNTVLYTDSNGKPIKTGKNKDTVVVKDFSYLTMKVPGSRMTKNSDLKKQAYNWILQNAPKTLTNKLFDKEQETS